MIRPCRHLKGKKDFNRSFITALRKNTAARFSVFLLIPAADAFIDVTECIRTEIMSRVCFTPPDGDAQPEWPSSSGRRSTRIFLGEFSRVLAPRGGGQPGRLQPGVLRYPSVAVAAAAGGTRAPAVREEANARPFGEVVDEGSRGGREGRGFLKEGRWLRW